MSESVKNTTGLVFFLFLFIALSNFIAAILILYFGESFILLAIKELFTVFMILVGFSCLSLTSISEVLIGKVIAILLLTLYIFFEFFVSKAGILPALISARQILSFYLIFLVGAVCYKFKGCSVLFSLILVGKFVFIYGVFERILYLNANWIGDFFAAKSIHLSSAGYPYVFIEPLSIYNEFPGITGFLRMHSTFLDPINLGHFFVVCYAVCYLMGDKLWSRLFSVGVLLCFSKSAMMQLLVFILYYQVPVPKLLKIFMVLVSLIISIVVLQGHAGFWIHLNGLMASLNSISLLGYGLGAVGNVASMYGEVNEIKGIGDTFFGALLGQVGIVGCLVFYLIMFYISRPRNIAFQPLYFLLIIQVGLSILSENAFNFLSLFYLVFLLGYLSVKYVPSNDLKGFTLNNR